MNKLKNNIKFRFVPLTFIKDEEIKRQAGNTLIFKYVLQKYGTIKELHSLLDKTQYGFTTSAKSIGSFRLLRITDINNGHVNWDKVPLCECNTPEKYLLQKGDVLIARTGNNISYLVESNVPNNVLFASYLIRLHCSNELLPEYLYSFLNSYAFWSQILQKQRGALLKNVNAKLMGQLLIPYCDIKIQKQIIDDIKKFDNSKIYFLQNKLESNLNKIFYIKTELTNQQSLLKQLRQAILQEAVEGKLTTGWRKQHTELISGENHAARLLEKIKAEKERLVKEGKIKKQKPLPPVSDEEKPFDLPEGWVYTYLYNIALKVQDGTHYSPQKQYKTKRENTFLYITSKNIKDNGIDIKNVTYIDAQVHKKIYERCNPEFGDLLIIKDGAVTGRVTLNNLNEEFSILSSVAFVKTDKKNVNNRYLMYYLRSPMGQKQIVGRMTGAAITRIILKRLQNTIIPLPPLIEQQAIVEKVDRLMAKIDALEEQVKERKAQAEQLMQAVLREAFNGDN